MKTTTANQADGRTTIRRTESRIELYDPERAEIIRRDPPLVMTVAETAAVVSKCPRAIRDDIAAGRITAIRIGGSIRIRREDLMRDLGRLPSAALDQTGTAVEAIQPSFSNGQ
jgi:excisionase family DNA binding protein